LFADDTSVIVSNPNITDLEWNLNWVFKKMNELFNRNSLSLNFSTTCFMQFHSKNNFLQQYVLIMTIGLYQIIQT